MLRVLAGAALVLHGLIHLIGVVVPLRLADVEGFPYRTAILGGAVEVGDAGAVVLGVGWLLAAAAFVVAGVGVLARARWAVPLTAVAAGVSLLLCVAALPEAAAGAVIDVVILAALAFGALAHRSHLRPAAGTGASS